MTPSCQGCHCTRRFPDHQGPTTADRPTAAPIVTACAVVDCHTPIANTSSRYTTRPRTSSSLSPPRRASTYTSATTTTTLAPKAAEAASTSVVEAGFATEEKGRKDMDLGRDTTSPVVAAIVRRWLSFLVRLVSKRLRVSSVGWIARRA
ncbi:unnamed protein product [Closterium sp. NIES-54]